MIHFSKDLERKGNPTNSEKTLIFTMALLEGLLNKEIKAGRVTQDTKDYIMVNLREQSLDVIKTLRW